jgi:GT2 family glycosyltransferase
MVDAMQLDGKIGVCGCSIVNVGHESDPNLGQGISLYTATPSHWRHRRDACEPVEVDFICGAAIMFRVEMIRRVGMFDECFLLMCEDSDICFRARKSGYRVCFVPGPGVRHLLSQTTKHYSCLRTFVATRNRIWLVRRHGDLGQRVVFNLHSFFYLYPKAIFGRIFRRQFSLLQPLLRGIWEGHWKYPGPYQCTTQDANGQTG